MTGRSAAESADKAMRPVARLIHCARRREDMVAESASPHHDLAVNEAKDLACALADAEPLLWGGSVLAARASRRLAQWMRRATGRIALSADSAGLGVIHDDKDRATHLTVKVRISEGIPPRSRINDRTQRCGVGGQGDTTRGTMTSPSTRLRISRVR
jgi:hypothetical protein